MALSGGSTCYHRIRAHPRQRGTIYGRAQFSWLRNGGKISTKLDVIWGMSVKKHSVEIGDCFVKPETPGTVWVVQRIVDHSGLPLHARLISRGRIDRRIVLSVSTLLDRSLYQRIEQ